MKVWLIQLTPNPIGLMTLACRTCYSNLDKEIEQLTDMDNAIQYHKESIKQISEEGLTDMNNPNHQEAIKILRNQHMHFNPNIKLVKNVLKRGHLSIAEHVQTTWLITNVSRSLTHQLVRHRLCSFSQQSQRYVDMQHFEYIDPLEIDPNKYPDISIQDAHDIKRELNSFHTYVQELYQKLINYGLKKEDARYILPNSTPTNILMTCNLRELMHILNLRCCLRSQTEIRKLANMMREQIIEQLPELKEFFGPKCEVINQKCFEQDECPKFKNKEE